MWQHPQQHQQQMQPSMAPRPSAFGASAPVAAYGGGGPYGGYGVPQQQMPRQSQPQVQPQVQAHHQSFSGIGSQPLTPKGHLSQPLAPHGQPTHGMYADGLVASHGHGHVGHASVGHAGGIGHVASGPVAAAGPSAREQALEHRVRELERVVGEKDYKIQELQEALQNNVGRMNSAAPKKAQRAGRPGAHSGFRKIADSNPIIKYTASDQDDPIDVRLEEFYNSTGSAIQFRRINKGFYRFGDSTVELDIVNHKLMARTEDGWNRGKFGPIEKYLMYYENIEREKAGIVTEFKQ